MAVVEERPPVPLCRNCNTRIPLGWKALTGKARCPKCGEPVPRFLLRKVPWWIVLHFKPDFITDQH